MDNPIGAIFYNIGSILLDKSIMPKALDNLLQTKNRI